MPLRPEPPPTPPPPVDREVGSSRIALVLGGLSVVYVLIMVLVANC